MVVLKRFDNALLEQDNVFLLLQKDGVGGIERKVRLD